MASLSEHGIRLSAMSPSFLNSNSTSHMWPFSAVAELVDNASDPGVYAKQIWIDVIDEAGHPCLTFIDNGSGMTPNKLHKMLSFGFTEKGLGKATQQAIGVYGNGFKSGSMRLGRDALIFTKNGGCQSVGMLSQTYLENIKAQAVIVPIVPFNQKTKSLVVTEDSKASLAAILQHSIISSLEQIHAHFDSMATQKGTKILIWNIRRTTDGKTEIDFDADASDFRLPEIQIEELKKGLRNSGSPRAELNVPDMYYSLRAYLTILYLKPRTQIILRGKKIIAKLVLKRLTHTEHDVYKPQFSKMKVKVTFGMNPTNKEQYGIMMYHKNRLIKAYEKVGCQLKASGQREGVGVIGIIECNFLKPAHNKQDFEYTKEFRLTLGALGIKLNEYWKEVTEKKAREQEFQAVDKDEDDTEDGPMWLQCEECLKWRKVPAGHYIVFPESWHCSQNPNPRYRSCSFPEEAEENEELLTPSYQKKHKKQEHLKGGKRENSLEVCAFQDQEAQHELLSRSASEPIQPTFQPSCSPERCHTEDNTLKHGQTNTSHPADQHTDTHLKDEAQNRVLAQVPHKQLKAMGRDTVIKDKTQITQGWMRVKNVTHSPSRKTKETDTSEDTDMEPVERREESIDTLSHKRKPAFLSNSVKKKLCLLEKRQPDSKNMAEEVDPHKQTQVYEHLHQVEKPGGGAQEIPTHLTLTHSFTSTQNVMLPPLSQAEEPQRTTLPLTGNDRKAKVQKLADLEKKVQHLRRLLGLQVTKTLQDTVTSVDCSAEKPEELPLPAACREVGCQTNMGEISSSSCSLTHTVMVQDQRALCEPSEQNKNESGRRIRDSEAHEDNRSAEESLRSVRNNLVVLFTALLPQLDLTGISLETTDVDSILQQIIDVNSLKL